MTCSYGDDMDNTFHGGDPNSACRSRLDSSLLVGLDVLCDSRRAFLNGARETPIGGVVTLLPTHSTVVEIVEIVPVDAELITACQRLNEARDLIALDDNVSNDPREPLVEMADILKVDLKRTTLEPRAALAKKNGPWGGARWRKKVENHGEFEPSRDRGFVYFRAASCGGRKSRPPVTFPAG
ncbi:MAG TPA: hypothetical protein VMU26_23575 [Candidatus Polarisedimenticolia bacterium]|nr:hypothetical protein [Candidatus Polarisedimenticolia bacterium]